MGLYIEDSANSKEVWLYVHGECMYSDGNKAKSKSDFTSTFPICLVDNGAFNAAGICYNEQEFDAFNHPTDMRYKKWYVVKYSDLLNIVPELEAIIKNYKNIPK